MIHNFYLVASQCSKSKQCGFTSPIFFQKEILVDIASLGGSEVASAFVSIFESFSEHVRQEISCNDQSALAKPR